MQVRPAAKTPMSSLFDPNIIPSDEEFSHLRDDPRFEEERIFFDSLWNRYKPYADLHFQNEISRQFHARFWEMYLGCALMDQGHTIIQQSGTEHPDVCLSWNGSRIGVEATAPGPGHGDDAVPRLPKAERLPGLPFSEVTCFRPPDEKVILRYTSAIFTKYDKQYRSHLDKGIISPSEPYILAINGHNVPFSFDDDIPMIVQAVLAIGPPTILIDWETSKVVQAFYAFRPEIKKSSGEPISTSFFLQEEFAGISGVLYSEANARRIDRELGADFLFVHNPKATNPVPKGWINVGYEFRLEGDTLVKERLRKQS